MRRSLSFIFLLVLFASPVYLRRVVDDSEEVETERTAAASALEEGAESVTEAVSQSSHAEKQSELTGQRENKPQRHIWRSKKTKSSASNVVNNGKRPVNGRRRFCGGKKGQRKGCGKNIAIVYQPRSSLTDELNQVIDGMLRQLSQTVVNDTKMSAFHTRVAFIPMNLRVPQWAYAPLRNANQTTKTGNDTLAPNSVVEESLVITESVLDGEDAVNPEEEVNNKSEEESEDEAEQAASEDLPSIRIVLEAIEKKEPTEQEVQESKIPDIDSEIEDDDGNGEDEVVEESETEKNFPTYESVSADVEETDDVAEASEIDTVEYKPKSASSNASETRNSEDVRTQSRQGHRKDGYRPTRLMRKKQRGNGRFPLRLPRRTNAVITGLENVQRVGDVMIGDKDNLTVVIDAIIGIGPIDIEMKGSAEPSLRKTKATTHSLQAKLRLGLRNGKLISVLLKPIKIQPSEALETIRRRNGQDLPQKQQSARVAAHLSQEVSRLWNSAFLLRRMSRKLKQTFKNQDFLELIKNMHRN